MKKWLSDRVLSYRFWANGVAGAVTIATLLSLLSSLWWGLTFLEHPLPQYCLILAIVVFVGLLPHRLRTKRRWLLLWCIPILINLSLMAPVFLGPIRTKFDRVMAAVNQPNLIRIGHITLDHDNSDIHQAISLIQQQQTDLVSVLEVTPQFLSQLEAELKDYQLIGAEPRTNSHGSAWFVARQPAKPIRIIGSEIIHLPANSDRPLLKATVSYVGKTINLLCFHAIRPRSADTVAFQQLEFAALAQWSQTLLKSGHNLIVIGDFNNTPWSASFRKLLQESGLRNSQSGFGLQPTWHSKLPSFLQIPIDHCLHSFVFSTVDRAVGSNIGSDHLPLFVELRL